MSVLLVVLIVFAVSAAFALLLGATLGRAGATSDRQADEAVRARELRTKSRRTVTVVPDEDVA